MPTDLDTGHYATVDSIRKEAGFERNQEITDETIAEYRDEAESILNSAIGKNYALPLTAPYPLVLRFITRRIAAGMLLTKEYAGMTIGSTGTKEKGQGLIDETMKLVNQIGSREVLLTGAEGNSLQEGTGPSGWPNEQTEVQAAYYGTGGGVMFGIGDKY